MLALLSPKSDRLVVASMNEPKKILRHWRRRTTGDKSSIFEKKFLSVDLLFFFIVSRREMAGAEEKDFDKMKSFEIFQEILRQSEPFSTSNRQQPTLQTDTEKLLVHCASLFAKELVSKSSIVAKNRKQKNSIISADDVRFVLKNDWKVYDSTSFNKIDQN